MQRIKTDCRSLSSSLYESFLVLYPREYLEKHRPEMLQNFFDVECDSSSALRLWAFISMDLLMSLTYQHMRAKSSRAALFAFILFLPFLAMIALAILHNALTQNPGTGLVADFVSMHTSLAFALIFILPAIGVLAILADFAVDLVRERSWNPLRAGFIRDHLLAIGMLGLGILLLLFLPAHDTVPCILKGVLSSGFNGLGPLIQMCRQA